MAKTSQKAAHVDSELAAAEVGKLKAETEKLRAEEASIRQETAGRLRVVVPWLRALLPTIIAAFAASLASFLFSDSLLEQSRAEIRRDILKTYFSIENSGAGKRKQILDFVSYIGEEDSVLREWVEAERKVVNGVRGGVESETDERRSGLRVLRERRVEVLNLRTELLDELRSDVAVSWIESTPAASATSLPGSLAQVVSPAMQEKLFDLFVLAGAMRLPTSLYCDSFVEEREAVEQGELEDATRDDLLLLANQCRGELIEWVNSTALSSAEDLGRELGSATDLLLKSAGRSIASDDSPPTGETPG